MKIPAPTGSDAFTIEELPPDAVSPWYHVFSTETHPENKADSFNRGWGNTRFAPIRSPSGAFVHTWYAASTVDVALMESVLHDVNLAPPGMFEVDRLEHFHLASVRFTAPLRCVMLHTPFLPKLGLTRAQLIDSPPSHYNQTREWSKAAFAQCRTAHAIAYGSRRHDAGRCLMLFGQRVPKKFMRVEAVEPLALGERRRQVLRLIRSLGIAEI